MSVSFVASLTGGIFGEAASPQTSGAFSPTNAGDYIIAAGIDGTSGTASIVITGTGTYSQVNPPGNWNDTAGDTVTLYVNQSSTTASQTVTVTSGSSGFVEATAFEYSGAASSGSGSAKNNAAPGTGVGAIVGNSVTVPAGGMVVCFCYDANGNNSTISAAGTGNTRYNAIAGFCWADFPGTGGSITPTLTTNASGGDEYVVIQVVLNPAGGAAPILMGQACL